MEMIQFYNYNNSLIYSKLLNLTLHFSQLYQYYSNKPKTERLTFFTQIIPPIEKFFKKFISPNYWFPQRSILLSFWFTTICLQNIDIIYQIEKLLSIHQLRLNYTIDQYENKLKKCIITSNNIDEIKTTRKMMTNFEKEYNNYTSHIKKIENFFIKKKNKNKIAIIVSTISSLKKIFPNDIVLLIFQYLSNIPTNNYENLYEMYKKDINLIMEHCGYSDSRRMFVLKKYLENQKDVVNTILDICEI